MKGHIAILVLLLALVAAACVPYIPPIEDSDPPADPVNDTPVNDTAPESDLTLEVYCSFDERFCDRMWNETVPQLDERIEIEFRHFPLSVFPTAYNASLAVECAREQGTDREYVDALFAEDRNLTLPVLVDVAENLDLDAQALESCVVDAEYADVVDADYARGVEKGVRGTPSSFVTDGEHNVQVQGAQPLSVFEDAIARAEAGEWDDPEARLSIEAPEEVSLDVGEWTEVNVETTGEGEVRTRTYVEELTLIKPIADTPVLIAEPLPILRPVEFEDEDGNELAFDPAMQFPSVETVDGGFAFEGLVEVRWYIGLDRNITNFDGWIMFGDREILVEGDRGSHMMLVGGEGVTIESGTPEEAGGMMVEPLSYESVYGAVDRATFMIDEEAFSVDIDDSRTIDLLDREFRVSFLEWDGEREIVTVSIGVSGSETTLELPLAQSQRISIGGVSFDLEVLGLRQPLLDEYVLADFGGVEVELREGGFLAVDDTAFYVEDVFRTTIPVDTLSIRLRSGFDALRVSGSELEQFTTGGEWISTDIVYRDEGQFIAYGTDYGTLAPNEFVVDEVFGLFAFGVQTGFGEPELVFEDRSIERDGLSLRPLAPRNATLRIEATDDTGLTREHRVALIAE